MNRIPFDKKELEPIGMTPAFMPSQVPMPIYNTPITPKENYLMLMNGETPLWMPGSGDTQMFTPMMADNIARGFVFEAAKLDLAKAGGPDMFGVEWTYVPTVGGSMVQPGNPKVKDLNHWEDYITIPKVADIMDWEATAKRNKESYFKPEKALVATVLTGLFERLISFVDFEDAAYALVDEDQQDAVHRLFDKLCIFYDEYFMYYKKYFDVTTINFHDDWGSQRAPFFSLATVREMLVPYLKRVVESAHKYGMKLDLHSCGKNEMLVPAMIEAGVDSWSGQPMNDYYKLYELYGDKIVLGVPIRDLREGMSDEELYQAIENHVRTHPHSTCNSRGTDPRAYQFLYEASRRVFCG